VCENNCTCERYTERGQESKRRPSQCSLQQQVCYKTDQAPHQARAEEQRSERQPANSQECKSIPERIGCSLPDVMMRTVMRTVMRFVMNAVAVVSRAVIVTEAA
jgi:hypothetical protein